ncbi:hypothetical protein GCM10011490_15560 [Pseudoclavibacter endophyticus]|uniref:Nitroreductase n=1 Tax=Pseudoclavibacter endophyticus TaxID=1778590 RepID=A0A6H9WMT4_9MICO|nr:hypothetical protein [Pseudoclavibacter endophyticus]KAB1649061.1 hypothetical protein F8O04_01900 [Pseudoclavibacter endophyticus]GGA65799.1 hypothetical protein GCM10011490_15560 [Pseudoclavibacter endophyticus]
MSPIAANRTADLEALAGRVVRGAANAPSAHNTQPWLPRAVPGDAGVIELAIEHGRTLPAGDHTGRDTLLALGCWVEAAATVAAAEGAALEVELLPALDDPAVVARAEREEPVARIRIRPGAEVTGGADPALLDRRLTYRGAKTAVPGFLAEARQVIPSWIRLAPVAAADLAHFAALGTADTLRIPAITRELMTWLRLSPEHPRWGIDGLSAEVLQLPPAAARVGAAFTRRRRLRDTAVRMLRTGGDLWRRALLEVHLEAPGDAVQAQHVVLVVEANELDLGSGVELTRVLNSPLGLPASVVFEAGRALMRVWLVAASHGAAFAPQSAVLDSDLAAGELQFKLGLGRRELPLFVASVGVPDVPAPARSPRKAVAG